MTRNRPGMLGLKQACECRAHQKCSKDRDDCQLFLPWQRAIKFAACMVSAGWKKGSANCLYEATRGMIARKAESAANKAALLVKACGNRDYRLFRSTVKREAVRIAVSAASIIEIARGTDRGRDCPKCGKSMLRLDFMDSIGPASLAAWCCPDEEEICWLDVPFKNKKGNIYIPASLSAKKNVPRKP